MASIAGIPEVDPQRRKSPLAELATRVALTKPGTWFYSEVAARFDAGLVRATGGRVSSLAGLFPIVLLNVRGARSGIERTVPLVYFTDGGDVILMASSFGRPKFPAWYHNIKANPDVRLEDPVQRGILATLAASFTFAFIVSFKQGSLVGYSAELFSFAILIRI